jgi:hypothetical protein
MPRTALVEMHRPAFLSGLPKAVYQYGVKNGPGSGFHEEQEYAMTGES